jgi:hypothetical protein
MSRQLICKPAAPTSQLVVQHHLVLRMLHQSLVVVSLLCANVTYAIQPLTDSELDARYLETTSDRPLLLNPQDHVQKSPFEQMQMILASAATPDLSTTQHLLDWQNRQILVGNGVISNSQELFNTLSINEIGAERYSLRWSGNLDQVTDITNAPGLSFYGVDVELNDVALGSVTVEVVTF